jgi:hypothetical protein
LKVSRVAAAVASSVSLATLTCPTLPSESANRGSAAGLSHFEVRTYRSLLRNMVLTAVSFLFLAKALTRRRGKNPLLTICQLRLARTPGTPDRTRADAHRVSPGQHRRRQGQPRQSQKTRDSAHAESLWFYANGVKKRRCKVSTQRTRR